MCVCVCVCVCGGGAPIWLFLCNITLTWFQRWCIYETLRHTHPSSFLSSSSRCLGHLTSPLANHTPLHHPANNKCNGWSHQRVTRSSGIPGAKIIGLPLPAKKRRKKSKFPPNNLFKIRQEWFCCVQWERQAAVHNDVNLMGWQIDVGPWHLHVKRDRKSVV